jgi:hypothetical protein
MSETESIKLYDNVGVVDYSMNPNTKGGARKRKNKKQNSSKVNAQSKPQKSQRQQSQRQQFQRQQSQSQKQPIIAGGCLTCPKGKKKILAILKILTVVIPRQYAKYKKTFNKGTQTKPAVKNHRKNGKKTGGWWETDHCLECTKLSNTEIYQKKFDPQIMDTTYMNFYDAKPHSIYNLDTSLTDYTSRMGF